jgi:16S rRNA processing protein RimM
MGEGYFTLARILRPRGRIGEVAAEILTDFPQRLTQLQHVWLADGIGAPRRVAVRRCWLHHEQAIFHFHGVESISQAEKLRGTEVQLPISERVALPAGHYFITDLIGCEVWEVQEVEERMAVEKVKKNAPVDRDPSLETSVKLSASSTSPSTLLGVVRDVFPTGDETPGVPLLAVESARGELLIPFAQEICVRIEAAERRIEVRLPEGLREANE